MHNSPTPLQTDEEVIKSFPRYRGEGCTGYVVDYLGVKTRTSYISTLPQEGNIVEDYPIPLNFHATMLEWAGVLRAALDARTEIVALELGAGWAPWLVTVARAAQLRGIQKVRLVGVEASAQHCDYMRTHFLDNGLDPKQHTLLHGIAAAHDGTAAFPELADPAGNWGAAAITIYKTQFARVVRQRLRPVREFVRSWLSRSSDDPNIKRMPGFSLPTLMRPYRYVDLIHIDIQGDEYEVLRTAREAVKTKVKRLVIGTHSRKIEQELFNELTEQGWFLEADESCKCRQHGRQIQLHLDGCQVWRNTAFD